MAASAPQTTNASPTTGALLIWQRLALLSRAQMCRLSLLHVDLEKALTDNEPLVWSHDAQRPWVRLLRQVGVVLLSKTQLRRQRHQLKRDARPVVLAYFGAPTSQHRELFILDVQTRLIRRPLHALTRPRRGGPRPQTQGDLPDAHTTPNTHAAARVQRRL